MNYDEYGQCYVTGNELCDLLYKNPSLSITNFKIENQDAYRYNLSCRELYANLEKAIAYTTNTTQSIEEFDIEQQTHWHMPQSYLEMDIAKWVLDQCREEHELQRVGQELLLYQDRNLFNLLRYLKYLVDTLRENNVVWGVGRGSSVSSYVLYLIGIHKIDSIYYNLSIDEFLK